MHRYGLDTERARQTVRLATSIFDQTAPLHGLGRGARELLQTAAYLHEIGFAVSHANHTRHGQYLIMNSELLGYSARELSIVGNVVRAHGGRGPKKKHAEYARLRAEDRTLVTRLTAILTVAEALDRSGRSAVERVEVELAERAVCIEVVPSLDCRIEMWDARRKAPVFERVFGVSLTFEIANVGARESARE
jgi:exopolyphosphatase/guanosine-5'-triphosphate,3'-diphosphate pyrophosphatase